MDKQTKKRIEELEARVRQLELRPPRLVTVPYDYPYYTPTPSYPAFPSPLDIKDDHFWHGGSVEHVRQLQLPEN